MIGCCKPQSEGGEWKDIYGDPVRPRRTGYEHPLDALQISAWAAIAVLALLHYTVQIPFLHGAFFIVVLVISSVLIASVVLTKVALELYPQQDPAVFRTDLPRLNQDELVPESAEPCTEPCVFCRRFVQVGCKHCSVCDKCVPGFDHHCRWLNSCVGARNYRLFATFMGVAWMGMAWVAALSLYMIQWMLRDVDSFKRRMSTRAYRSPTRAFPAVVFFNFVSLLIAVAGICSLGKLICFHVYLDITHQSTYEHIVKKRERKRALGEYRSQSGEPEANGCLACFELRKRRYFKRHGGNNTTHPEVNDDDEYREADSSVPLHQRERTGTLGTGAGSEGGQRLTPHAKGRAFSLESRADGEVGQSAAYPAGSFFRTYEPVH
ncbi:hypothetical protein GH5_03528 [Leishmania sp. Ghana 2012 LV757]|uniref:hypothetical protein n=1 Tax=Leishmania sp. Ghana 2012 LV757 TaxID=2803181 RepID=UPI001B60632B|nr:hypothetical protein GH5_03528 [Leishmania sp. Ghana 2012 LV757]